MSSLDVPTWAWILLAIIMVVLIAIDLLAHRGDRTDSRRGALIWSGVWIGAALAFILTTIILLFTLIQFRVLGRRVHYG